MRILVFHGYLLRGTGSNVYNASLAAALSRLGHEVHLLCQDRDAARTARWPGPGSVTVHVPDIGGLLPVFVRDRYEGFAVKEFPELTDAELERYIELNVAAVRDVVARHGEPDAALANHLVMGPVVLARAGLRYALKVHGSDLSYTVLPHLERFGRYAEEACAGANGILVGSGHIAARLAQAVPAPEVTERVRLGPPGVDTDLFAPVPPADRRGRLRELAGALQSGEGFGRDLARARTAIAWLAEGEGPTVVFVGKLIVSKGVDLLLAAWPLVVREIPRARLAIVGFGELAGALESAWAALEGGELGPLRDLARRGRGLEGGSEKPLRMLAAFLDSLPDGYADAARAAAGSVTFAGRLEHDEVGRLVPTGDALVFPSTFPEAFGMVAAEAAAAGVLPISAAHSGAAEVSAALAEALPEGVGELVSFALDDDAVQAIAARLNAWLRLPEAVRKASAGSLRAAVVRLWSWDGVARGVIAAGRGDLRGLRRPGGQ